MHPMTLPAALTPPHSIDPALLAALPRTSGVYVFKGEGALPIYIGKSVDIRSRVLSHLRAADEAEMIAQCRRVEYIETAGEFGALLLEARLIKQLSPLFNIRLRRVRNLCSIQLSDLSGAVTPEIVTGKDVAVGQTEGLYGLFSSVHTAQSKLRELADQHMLCQGLLGLEKIGWLETQIMELKDLPSGWQVGYTGTYRTRRPTRLALLPAGYTSGVGVTEESNALRLRDRVYRLLHAGRALLRSDGLTGLVNGRRCPVRGVVGATQLALDVTDVPCAVGDTVRLEVRPKYVDSAVPREYR